MFLGSNNLGRTNSNKIDSMQQSKLDHTAHKNPPSVNGVSAAVFV
jgi:hypothetical protein